MAFRILPTRRTRPVARDFSAIKQIKTRILSLRLREPAVFIFLWLLILVGSAHAGHFTNTGSLRVSRGGGHTMTLLANGQVLVTGGSGLASAEIYNPTTGTWSLTNSMFAPRVNHTATLLQDGRVLVAGGSSYLATAEIFDPVSGNWTATGNLDLGRSFHTATLLPNGKVLVAGGYCALPYPSNYVATTELYDPATGVWTNTGDLNIARQDHAAVMLPNGKVLVTGGRQGTGLASSELYDPNTETWTITNSMLSPRANFTASLLPDGRVLVAGGMTNLNYYSLSSAEVFDPDTGAWSQTGPMNFTRALHAAAVLPNGKVLVVGGYPGVFTPPSGELSAETYDVATGSWTFAGALGGYRHSPTELLLPNGRILIAGGNGSSYSVTNATLYTEAVPIRISNLTRIASTQYRFSFTNLPGMSFSGLACTNPMAPANHWTVLSTVQEFAPGQYRVFDTQATTTQRFYRVRAN